MVRKEKGDQLSESRSRSTRGGLDDKLYDILCPDIDGPINSVDQINLAIAQIKQAFIDNGWHFHGAKQDLEDYLRWSKEEQELAGQPKMTGQEWYRNFQDYSDGVWDNRKSKFTIYNQMIEAAKEASGIKE